MRQPIEYRTRSLAPSRTSTERPILVHPTRTSVVSAVSSQIRAQARAAATR